VCFVVPSPNSTSSTEVSAAGTRSVTLSARFVPVTISWAVSITTLLAGAAAAGPARLAAMPMLAAETAAALRPRRKPNVT
jgi:hypothetical protein